MRQFDLAVIGSGPAGQKAAIQAAKVGRRVVIIEKRDVLGGATINTGTIPSKALREAVLHLTGASKRGLFGEGYRVKRNITVGDLIYVSQQVIHHELQLVRSQLDRNGVEIAWGEAHFEAPHRIQVSRADDCDTIGADKVVIATGTRPARPPHVPFDDHTVLCSDALLQLDHLPKTMIVVGGGVIGVEYACMLATVGVKVTLVEGRRQVLGFLDQEIAEAFQYHMRRMGITLRLGEKVAKIERIAEAATNPLPIPVEQLANAEPAPASPVDLTAAGPPRPADGSGGGGTNHADPDAGATCERPVAPHSAVPLVQATLESGKQLRAETLLYAVGRQGTTGALRLENVGLRADDRERLHVNEHYQTAVPHIYAAGDVIGFPALASAAMEQGRLAACHACGIPAHSIPELFPYGIYSIPEMSMVGKTEEQLTEAGIPYEAGVAQYKELARGQLLGDETGMLKLLIHQERHTILGVHAIGTDATELIHIGQAVMALGGTVHYFINNVFNFPTLAEAYKVAALNGLNKLRHI
jgi:NAD(P) transhydrogenase